MSTETFEERIELGYVFLACEEGYWRNVESIIEISSMSKTHLENSINMIRNWRVSHRDKAYKQEIEQMIENKIKELEKALSKT
jgi:hypothetical protein